LFSKIGFVAASLFFLFFSQVILNKINYVILVENFSNILAYFP